MKIVHIVYSLEFGGIETMLVNIVNEQISMGHDIGIICINNAINSGLREAIDKKVKLYCIGRPIGSKNPYYLLKFNYKLYSLKSDIIHVHSPSITRYILFNLLKGKMCTTRHAPHNPIESNYLPYFKYIYSISNSVREDEIKNMNIDSKVILNGVNVSNIKSKINLSEFNAPLKLIQVSRINHLIKGQHILIQAIKIVKEGGYNISVDFIGDGPSFDYLTEQIKKLGLENEVKLLGAKSQQYIFEHLCEYDLFVQPSIYEGFGLTVAEAMAAKIPVLVSENQGPLEIIDNGKYGYSFKNGDANDCADKIINIIEQGVDLDMINAAYKRVEELYSVQQTARNYINEYKLILENR
ncbi:MAG: glycosyltransferase [Bacteroidales bacterium]|nr:glycosyltransferase [Bacteroidales bacterium]MBQ7819841.1 glycosyltransferase [Bacteroidales bacterium]